MVLVDWVSQTAWASGAVSEHHQPSVFNQSLALFLVINSFPSGGGLLPIKQECVAGLYLHILQGLGFSEFFCGGFMVFRLCIFQVSHTSDFVNLFLYLTSKMLNYRRSAFLRTSGEHKFTQMPFTLGYRLGISADLVVPSYSPPASAVSAKISTNRKIFILNYIFIVCIKLSSSFHCFLHMCLFYIWSSLLIPCLFHSSKLTFLRKIALKVIPEFLCFFK